MHWTNWTNILPLDCCKFGTEWVLKTQHRKAFISGVASAGESMASPFSQASHASAASNAVSLRKRLPTSNTTVWNEFGPIHQRDGNSISFHFARCFASFIFHTYCESNGNQPSSAPETVRDGPNWTVSDADVCRAFRRHRFPDPRSVPWLCSLTFK